MPRLFHFSENPSITRFEPRPVAATINLHNGQSIQHCVWAIAEETASMYLFPREQPRILLWRVDSSSQSDVDYWLGSPPVRAVAFIERADMAKLSDAVIWRYEMPSESFVDLKDAGMWVSRSAVTPIRVDRLGDLPSLLAATGVELRLVGTLVELADLWKTTLHVSGIRLHKSPDWAAAFP